MQKIFATVESVGDIFASVRVNGKVIRVPLGLGMYVVDGLNQPEPSEFKPDWVKPLETPIPGSQIVVYLEEPFGVVCWVYAKAHMDSVRRINRRDDESRKRELQSRLRTSEHAPYKVF